MFRFRRLLSTTIAEVRPRHSYLSTFPSDATVVVSPATAVAATTSAFPVSPTLHIPLHPSTSRAVRNRPSQSLPKITSPEALSAFASASIGSSPGSLVDAILPSVEYYANEDDGSSDIKWRAAMLRTEACLRGYQYSVIDGGSDADFAVRQMTRILGRVEDEAWVLYEKGGSSSGETNSEYREKMFLPNFKTGASSHLPSIALYNLLLDVYAYASASDEKYAVAAHDLLVKLEEAFNHQKGLTRLGGLVAVDDLGKDDEEKKVRDDTLRKNIAPPPIPVWAPVRRSYNTVLAASMNISDVGTGIRTAFDTYERMGTSSPPGVNRNSETFALSIRAADRHLAESGERRALIVRAMFSGACKEGVVNETVLEAVHSIEMEGTDDRFVYWMEEEDGGMKNKSVGDFARKFVQNSKSRDF